jgi:hypothetical protein
LKKKVFLPIAAFFLLASIVGCSPEAADPDEGTEHEAAHNHNEHTNVEEKKDQTEEKINEQPLIVFKGVNLPKEAMERFDAAVNDVKAEQSKVQLLFMELLQWMEKNASSSIGFYMNYLEINKTLGYPENTHPYQLLKILNDELLKDPNQVTNKEFRNKLITIAENGLMFRTAEGDFEAAIDYRYLLNKYDDILSEEIKEYLQIRASNSNIYDEKDIIASYSQLAKNILVAERFLTKYAESDMRKVVKNIYANELASYLLSGNQVKAEMKNIYETFLKEYQGSKTQTYKVVEEFYDLLNDNNFKYSDEVYKYINKTVDQVR